MRARIKQTFRITGRGTVLVIELLEGRVQRGDSIAYPTRQGDRLRLVVEGAESVDHTAERRSDIGLVVKGLDPADVPDGQEITGT